MKIALYLRVSTDKQETENQAIQLREFAAKHGWEIIGEYCDYESGAKADRVAFKQMFADASKRKFDMVLFWALDRFSREGVLPTLQHLNQLESYGVGYPVLLALQPSLEETQHRPHVSVVATSDVYPDRSPLPGRYTVGNRTAIPIRRGDGLQARRRPESRVGGGQA
jgi:hypothetical protein